MRLLSGLQHISHFHYDTWYMLSDLPTAIYTRLKLLLLIKSKACSACVWMCFLGISTLLIILLTAFTRLPVCLTCAGMEPDVGVAEHLTDLLQIKSVYWIVLTCWHGHQQTLLNACNSLADVCLQLCACLCVCQMRMDMHVCVQAEAWTFSLQQC